MKPMNKTPVDYYTTPEISELVRLESELPENTEIYNSYSGWSKLSETARKAANRKSHIYADNRPFWLTGWRDLWPRLRLRSIKE